MMSPNRLFWFEVEDGCFGCLLLCPESRMGEKPPSSEICIKGEAS